MTFTKKPRFATPSPSLSPTPKAAACATTSVAPQQRCKLLEYGLFGRINDDDEEEEDDDGGDEEEEEPTEEMEEEAYESSDKEEKTDGQLSVILSDPDVLDCPICLEPLTLPVFQVKQGNCRIGEVEAGDDNNGVVLGCSRRLLEKSEDIIKLSGRNCYS